MAPVALIPSAFPPALISLSTIVAPDLCAIIAGQVKEPPHHFWDEHSPLP